ncbi:MAG: hypothetical protein FD139_3568 [Methylocystaceae bacterium]|nr:MAG: hypothetical protein FD172_3738 [Methylocystaceae bacterium]TXT42520.1 MAG: hypothetical protein FD139_3568 [Methylocystaceae bacterium]
MGQGWLIIERFENWEVDAANNFSFFGLPSRHRKIATEIVKGDRVYCYVSSGRSSFSDIRVVQETGLKRLKEQAYDSAYTFAFSTTPLLVLPRASWIPIKEVVGELDLTRGRADYRPLFQTSIRKLTEHDAAFLDKEMRDAAMKSQSA